MPSGIYKYEPLWGEWKIDSLIGRGSYGEVYKIYKEEDGQRVEAAAKYISIPKNENDIEIAINKGFATDDDESLRNFFETRANSFSKEIDLMMKLQNEKNIVSYEAHIKTEKKEEIGWDLIIRMELLTPLDRYLKEHTFSKKEVVRLGIDLCKAIESCQKEKIIHRDVKIENIFLDVNKNFKLGDFGVSREAKGTTMGTLAGTEDYMAPEITKHLKYNNNVDIYSIGIVMYRLLNNNRIPFLKADGAINDADIAQALEKRLNGTEEIPPPKYADGRLAEIILKACHYDRHQRYASPDEMAHDLEEILNQVENQIVLEPRKKFAKSDTKEHTIADLTSKTDTSGTYSEVSRQDTISEAGKGQKTVYDKQAMQAAPEKKKKKLLWILPSAAVLCLVGVLIYFAIPKSVPIKDIAGLQTEMQAVAGAEIPLSYILLPENTTEKPVFSSSNRDIAEISEDGTIIAKAEGVVEITVKSGKVEKTIRLNVSPDKIPVEDILYVYESEALEVGAGLPLEPQLVPENATEQIVYSSSDTGIATVDQTGYVTAVAAGQTIISVSAGNVRKEMVLTVTAPQSAATQEPTPQPTPRSTPKSTSQPTTTPRSTPQQQVQPQTAQPSAPAVNDSPPANNTGGGNSNDKYRIDPGEGTGLESAM